MHEPRTILDLGCGPGDEAAYLAEQLPAADIIGVDFAENMIEFADSEHANATFILSDITTFVPEAKVQGIWVHAALHHLSDEKVANLFKRISTYADEDLLIGTVNKLGNHEEVEEKQKYGTSLKRYFNYFNPDKISQLAGRYGYTIMNEYEKSEGEHVFLVTFLAKK